MKDIRTLSDQVRQTPYEVPVYHGHGHLEKVSETALAHRLRKAGLDVNRQHPLKLYDEDGTLMKQLPLLHPMEERVGERRCVGFFGLPLSSVLSPLLRPPSAVVHHLLSDLPGLLRRTGRGGRKKICAS
jgi:hypothetical protein